MTSNLTTLFIIGISAMLLLFAGVMAAVLFTFRKRAQHKKAMQDLKEQQQNQLIEAAVRSEETERHRIAETLHDEVGAILSSAKLHLLGIKGNTLDEKDKTMYDKGSNLLNNAIKRVRGISHNMHSKLLDAFGFNEALRDFLKEVSGGGALDITTNLDEHYNQKNPETDINLYRMIQELVNNIIKYAGAKNLSVASRLEAGLLTVTIFHDGDGLNQQQFEVLAYQKEGLGLKNIMNRIILLKGKILFEKREGGYSIDISIPVNAKPVENEKDKTGHSG